jgi:hypothetical protein
MEDEDILVRLTGGNLIVNSKLIFECLKIFETQKNDYMYINPKKNNVPVGLSVEIFKVKLLRNDGLNSKLSKEHVTYNFIKKNNTLNIKNTFKKKLHIFRCSLDYIEDYFLLKKILEKYNLKSEWKMICKSLLTYRINKKNKFKFLVKKKIKIVGLSKGEKIHKELITHNELARTYFLNNCIKKNNNLIKKNFEDEFRSDMPYNLNIKQIKNFLIKDLKLLIPKFYKEHH